MNSRDSGILISFFFKTFVGKEDSQDPRKMGQN